MRPLRHLRRDRLTVVWLILVLATVLSWRVGEDHGLDGHLATVIVLVVAFFKVRLIGLHLMELRGAPRELRAGFEAYCLVVCAGLIGVYLGGGA